MNDILSNDDNLEPSIFDETMPEDLKKQAKITGLLCIGGAVSAMSFGLFSPTLYFLFLCLSATFGLIGYSEISSRRTGFLNLVIMLISAVILILLFLSLGSTITTQFTVFYGLLSILVPVMIAISALTANRVERWKALVPLLIPAFYVISQVAANSRNFLSAFLILPIGWGLLGIVAFLGNKNVRQAKVF